MTAVPLLVTGGHGQLATALAQLAPEFLKAGYRVVVAGRRRDIDRPERTGAGQGDPTSRGLTGTVPAGLARGARINS